MNTPERDAQRLNQIKVREKAATKGTWVAEGTSIYGAPTGGDHSYAFPMIADFVRWESNAEFISHAREDIPWLIEQIHKRDAAIQAVLALTYASDDGTEFEHDDHELFEGAAECPACWVLDIKSAITRNVT